MHSLFRTTLTTSCLLLALFTLGLGLSSCQASANPEKPIKGTVDSAYAGPLRIGTKAPNFDLKATGNIRVKLDDLRGAPFILVFYPMDFTSGCTAQLCALRDTKAQFDALGVEIIASNPATLSSHERFAAHHGYYFPILVDSDGKMAEDYHAKGLMGIPKRTVYVIDAKGIVRFSKRGAPSPDLLLQEVKAAMASEWKPLQEPF